MLEQYMISTHSFYMSTFGSYYIVFVVVSGLGASDIDYIILKNQSVPPCNLSLSVSFRQCCILIFHSCTIQRVVLFHGT